MTSKTVGLHLYNRSGGWDVLTESNPEDEIYIYNESTRELEVLFAPNHGRVIKYEPPFESLMYRLKRAAPDGLAFVRIPKRRSVNMELNLLRREGIVTEDTKITKGF